MANILKISKLKEEIIIKVNVKDLIKVSKTHPEYPFKVLDKNKFADKVVFMLENYANQNDVEKGSTHLEELFDTILEQVAESGEDFVKSIEVD